MSFLRRAVSRISGRARRGGRAYGAPPDTAEARALDEKVAAVPFWFLSIDLGMGVVTPGLKSPEVDERELAALRHPRRVR